MMSAERKIKIIEYVKKHRTASVTELSQQFNVHETTIRRDLIQIEKEGLLKRTHGGIMLAEDRISEPPFHERENENMNEKIRIGKYAASTIYDGEHIILDSGTTTLQIAKHLGEYKNLTVITNDINIAMVLSKKKGIKVIVSGGTLYQDSYFLNGIITNYALHSFQVDKSFIATPAIHVNIGLSHFDEVPVSAKVHMIEAAKRVIVLTDHAKIGQTCLYKVSSIDMINEMITGIECNEYETEQYTKIGLKVTRV